MHAHEQKPERPADLMSVRRAAGVVGIGEPLIWRLIRTHEIGSYRDGDATRVSVAELDAWRGVTTIPPDRQARIVELFVSAIRRQARARCNGA